MSKLQCEKCLKVFKAKAGLTIHRKSCTKPEQEVEETIEEVKDEVVSNVELSDKIERQLKKLRDARASTWDAESRHIIDLKIKALLEG